MNTSTVERVFRLPTPPAEPNLSPRNHPKKGESYEGYAP